MHPWTRTKHLICTVPPSLTYNTGYSDSKIRFYTTFNGYLYLYFSGRLLRLWVDIGYLSKFLDMKDMHLESELSCNASNRCLTVWDRKFPAIGTFPGGKGLEIVHGRGEGMDRYVAVRGAFGRVVGDLITGKTHYSSGKGITIPIVKDDGNVGFCGVNTQASSYLIERVKETKDGNVGDDLSEDFAKYFSEREEDKIDISKIQDDPADASILNDVRDLSEEYPWEIEGEEEREKERHGKLKREKENREREEKERLERAKAKEDNGGIQVVSVVDKDVVEISSGSDYGSDEEDEEELASDATDEEFGKYDNSDWKERRYRDEEYARYRYYHDGPLSDDEEEEEEEVYDEWHAFDDPEYYHDIFRELPSVDLNPSWINAPRAFVSVDEM